MPDRYPERDGILPQRGHSPIRAEEARRLSLIGRLVRRKPADEKADPERLAAIGATVRAKLLADPRARPHGGHRADLFSVPDFVSAQRCRELVALIESDASPSTLFRHGSSGADIRTSSTHYFGDHPAALKLGREIDALLGLPRAHAEPMQGQRYRVREHYRHHSDHFRLDRQHWHRERERGGQRSWTAMLYLNTVQSGGATDFPRLRLAILPKPGLLVVWNNMDRRGQPNPALLHAGMTVETGVKYVVTQWYRQMSWSG